MMDSKPECLCRTLYLKGLWGSDTNGGSVEFELLLKFKVSNPLQVPTDEDTSGFLDLPPSQDWY